MLTRLKNEAEANVRTDVNAKTKTQVLHHNITSVANHRHRIYTNNISVIITIIPIME